MVNSGYGICRRTDRASWVRRTVSNLSSPRMTASHPETSARSHLRAIHKLALSTHLPHYCITGSADGDMRAWVRTCSSSKTQRADYAQDLRDLHRSVLRLPFSTAVRAAVFSPDNTHALQIALGLDDGSLLRWDLRMGARGSLDRLPVAHVGPVMSLDWVPATGAPASSSPASSTIESDGITGDAMSRDGVGWIASAGLDKTIKVW
jgi:WD40 repeat protein